MANEFTRREPRLLGFRRVVFPKNAGRLGSPYSIVTRWIWHCSLPIAKTVKYTQRYQYASNFKTNSMYVISLQVYDLILCR